jgi:hypothetical protein
MFLHGVWNGLSADGPPGLAIGYAIMFCVAIGVLVVLVRDRRRLVRLIGRYLPPYEATGLVTAADIGMLGSLRRRRGARAWARAAAGRPAAEAMGDYQLAATELALLHSKADHGVVTSPEFLDRQYDLVALMHAAREAFLSRSQPPPPAPWASPGGSGFAHGTPRRASLPPPAPLPPQWG